MNSATLASSLSYSRLFAQRPANAGAVAAAITRITVPADVMRRLDEPGGTITTAGSSTDVDSPVVRHLQRGTVDHQHRVLAVDVVGRDLVAGLASVQPISIAWLRVHHVAAAVVVLLVGGRRVQFAVLRRAGDAGRRAPCGGQLRSRIVLVVGHDSQS